VKITPQVIPQDRLIWLLMISRMPLSGARIANTGNGCLLIMFHVKSAKKTNPGAMHRTNQIGSALTGKDRKRSGRIIEGEY
jgi:hypothetical protein